MPPVNSHPSDAALVTRVRGGDQAAFSALVDRHFGVVFAIARARLGQREAAEDLAQEVFIRVHLYLSSLRDPDRFAAWVCRLTRNLATDWTRRGQRRSTVLPLIPLDERVESTMPAKEPSPREEMEREQDSAAIRESIDRLSPDLREIVLLHYSENLSLREIAKRLDSNHMTVSRKLDRALGEMRGVIESALRAPASSFRPHARLAARASALAAIVAASSEVQSAVAAAAPSVAAVGKATGAVGAASGFLQSLTALAVSGGKLMAVNKAAVAIVVATVAVGGVAYNVSHRHANAPASTTHAVSTEDPRLVPLTERAAELRQVYADAQSQVPFASAPYAGLLAMFGAMTPEDSKGAMVWLYANEIPWEVMEVVTQHQEFNAELAITEVSAREIMGVQAPASPTEHSIAHVRFVEPISRQIQSELWIFEDGIWKMFLPYMTDVELNGFLEANEVEIRNGRLIALGNYAEGAIQLIHEEIPE